MASSGSKSISVTAYDTLKFSWTQAAQSSVNNTTTVNWTLQLISGSAGEIISSVVKNWTVMVDGVAYSGTNSVAIGNNTSKTLASGQTIIYHSADGTKSFSYAFSQEFNITFAGASVGKISGTGTGELNPIARATTPVPGVSSADMGATIIIYTSRASEAFTHDLEYSFAGGDYLTIAKDVATSIYWQIPLSLANSIPDTTSGTVTIRCTTKNGTAVVGSKTALLTAKVPTTVIPTITSVTLAEANTGAVASIGAFVQSKSRIKATIIASGAYGSTIQSYTSTFEGRNYTGASFTTNEVAGGGALNLKITVTDSRGRTATKTIDLTVLSYTPPTISSFQVRRYNSAGIADSDGAYAGIRLAYSVTSLNARNTASAKIEYKRSTATAWTTLQTETALSGNVTIMPTTVFTTDYQWDFRVTLTDAFNSATPATYNTVLPSGAVIFDIKADGKGIAFLKTCTRDGVEIAGELPGSAVNLTSGANLNNLTAPGYYVIPTSAISATITNKPYNETAMASIKVEQVGNGMLRQTLQKASKTDGVIYERGYDSSGWGAWSVVYAGQARLLWTGSSLLTASQTVTFGEKMSVQKNGIVLVFSRYISNAAVDYFYSCHFVPKMLVTAATNAGQTSATVTFMMATNKFEAITGKYLRITDTGITGDDANSANGTANGITYNNSQFALRYVIGV